MSKRSSRTEEYRRLYDAGKNFSEIAAECGVSVSSVSQWARLAGLASPHRGNVPDATRQRLPDGVEARPIPGYRAYLCTEDGRIWSARTTPPVALLPGKVLAGPRYTLTDDAGRVREVHAAPAILAAWREPRPRGAVVRYEDGDRSNVAASNLTWKYPPTRADPAEFVRVYQSSATAEEASDRLGISLQSVYTMARKLRERGVPLKRFRVIEIDDATIADLIRLAETEEGDTP